MERTGAAAIIIGNEVLTAKVQDQNGPHLIKRLREVGIPLRSVETILDDVDAIVDAMNRARQRARYVFTSGGIGPTHDDVTVRAVAMALGRSVVRLPEMVSLIEARAPEGKVTPEGMRLADAPEGAVLLPQAGTWYPVLTVGDVYLLPGVPQLFRMQLETVLARLSGSPVVLQNLFLRLGESEIAAVLDSVALNMPHVAIGSYPEFDPAKDYRVKITVEAGERGPVEEAVARIIGGLPDGAVLRRE
ncbi:competence/damage-inducible protein A [Myxococcus sp. MISCRS1]|uniref:competence/damage-inducible protein A n=1 Tax=Myxococcus TaxID=32 RepID=UPI001144800B|nr:MULTISPECIES: competence/damage-inducible protein A [Myxococcus]MCK8499449.1 competence/damage-inducible protein A [Myxococcus fulvus]MCY1003334.1 competence/damage-inducible protein A [Myxococcus sp. MISCRS1]BDT35063.1 competence/damage-inducible protein A [Myxococcus sp. MH1]